MGRQQLKWHQVKQGLIERLYRSLQDNHQTDPQLLRIKQLIINYIITSWGLNDNYRQSINTVLRQLVTTLLKKYFSVHAFHAQDKLYFEPQETTELVDALLAPFIASEHYLDNDIFIRRLQLHKYKVQQPKTFCQYICNYSHTFADHQIAHDISERLKENKGQQAAKNIFETSYVVKQDFIRQGFADLNQTDTSQQRTWHILYNSFRLSPFLAYFSAAIPGYIPSSLLGKASLLTGCGALFVTASYGTEKLKTYLQEQPRQFTDLPLEFRNKIDARFIQGIENIARFAAIKNSGQSFIPMLRELSAATIEWQYENITVQYHPDKPGQIIELWSQNSAYPNQTHYVHWCEETTKELITESQAYNTFRQAAYDGHMAPPTETQGFIKADDGVLKLKASEATTRFLFFKQVAETNQADQSKYLYAAQAYGEDTDPDVLAL